MRARRTIAALAATCLVGVACGDSGISQEDLDALQRQLDDTDASAEAARSELADAQRSLREAQSRVSDLEQDVQQATDQAASAEDVAASLEAELAALEEAKTTAEQGLAEALDDAEEEQRAADEAERRLEELLVAYDPEIQAARDSLAAAAVPLACDLATAAGLDGSAAPSTADVVATLDAEAVGFQAEDLVDQEALEAELARCYGDAQAEAEALALQARLTEDKGSGFYTVGDEIAPGRWRSAGTGDDCYWARLDADQEILDNHFGNAGGSVTIRATDYEVEFSDCGTWEYLGP